MRTEANTQPIHFEFRRMSFLASQLLIFIVFAAISACSSPPSQTRKVLLSSEQIRSKENISEKEKPDRIPPQTDYLLQAGDEIEIQHYYYPKLNQRLIIRPDGGINLPLVGDVKAGDKNPESFSKELASLYGKHVKFPDVSVMLIHAESHRVYVGGEVFNPAPFAISGKMTVLKAIFMAGGFKKTAALENIVVLRNQAADLPLFITLNLYDNINGIQNNDIILKSNDIVYVPKTAVAKWNDFIEQYIDKMVPIERFMGFQYNLNKVVE